MNDTKRKRLEKRIQRFIAELAIKGLKDPNIGFVTFTGCELSPDALYAKVYVSIFEDELQRKKTLQALQRATGFIRFRLGKHLEVKSVPHIQFIEDESLNKAESIEKLIDRESGLITNEEPDDLSDDT